MCFVSIVKVNTNVPGPGNNINYLASKYEVANAITLHTLNINGSFLPYVGEACSGLPSPITGISSVSLPSGSTHGYVFQTPSPGLISGVGIESAKLVSLSVGGSGITSPIQVITISGTKYVVFSQVNECADLPTDLPDIT
jgi:hypothetical protein